MRLFLYRLLLLILIETTIGNGIKTDATIHL